MSLPKLFSYNLFALLLIGVVACSTPVVDRFEDDYGQDLPSFGQAAAIAQVIDVIDGTTIDVMIDDQLHRVRYLGVESKDDKFENQSPAFDYNRFLVSGQQVELVSDVVDSDLSGTLLRYVYVNGEMVNASLLRNGYAEVAQFPNFFKFQTDFLLAEDLARSNNVGVWDALPDNDSPIVSASTEPSNIPKFGGTLPRKPSSSGGGTGPGSHMCGASGGNVIIVKAVMTSESDKLFYLPDHPKYLSTVINELSGDKIFCNRFEAIAAGWSEAP